MPSDVAAVPWPDARAKSGRTRPRPNIGPFAVLEFDEIDLNFNESLPGTVSRSNRSPVASGHIPGPISARHTHRNKALANLDFIAWYFAHRRSPRPPGRATRLRLAPWDP